MATVSAESVSLQGDKYLGTPYSSLDCQGLWERMLQDAGLTCNLAGSNAWWRAMSWTGTPEKCKEIFGRIPIGACLFILKSDKGEEQRGYHDGLGNASHIGVYTGRSAIAMLGVRTVGMSMADTEKLHKRVCFGDGAIHSSSSRACVATSTFDGKTIPNGGWNRVGLWLRLSYGPDIDRKLAELGATPGPLVVTGEPVATPTDLSGGLVSGDGATVVSSNGGSVNVRQKPKGAKITQLPPGTPVDVLEVRDGWARVAYTATGWMMTDFLRKGVG